MTTITDSALRTARETTVAAHVAAECRGDIAATLATFADANYDVVPMGEPSLGAEAVTGLLGALFTAFPDFHAEVLALHHGDDIVFTDVRITGTHQGPWAGTAAGGGRIDVRCACVFHFDGEHLTKETVYFDHLTLLRQIGAIG